jgi:transcriptional regulator with XRE-family HTH domain
MEHTLSQKVGKKLRKMREEREWKQYTVAEMLQISENNYGSIERGEICMNLEKLAQIAQVFDITPAELLCESTQIVNNIQQHQNGTHGGFIVNWHGASAPHEHEKLLLRYEMLEKEIAHLKEINDLLKQVKK